MYFFLDVLPLTLYPLQYNFPNLLSLSRSLAGDYEEVKL